MKIAFLHMTMGLVERGSEVVVDSLATELSANHEILVIQSGKPTKKSYQVKQLLPLDIAPIPAPTNILNKVLFRLHLDDESGRVAQFTQATLPVLDAFVPDIIVAINGPLQVRLLKRSSLHSKIVTFGHAGIGYHDRDTLRAHPDLFVALTPQAEVWAAQFASKHTKITYIPNPIDTKRFTHVKPSKTKLDKPIVLTVSALSKYKNVLNVLSAIRQTSASYLLIGEGEQTEDVAHSFSTMANSFLWIKHQDRSLMPSYYAAADVFCFTPDPQEAFGMVYLEAMATGLPIVASDDPIRRNLIGPSGIYVDPHNVDDIATGIASAIKHGKVDYSAELKSYALKNVVSQLEKEFHDLL